MIAPFSRRWPRIVAESLAGVAEPITTIGRRPVRATTAEVLAAADAAMSPGRARALPPAFLQPQQIDPWQRVHHALAHWGGALLAEPTGTGKTWIALGIAALERRPAVVIAPAVLLSQWNEAARRADVPISVWSQERVSRGALPPHSPRLVIVDEAHRLRDPGIRRVRALAPWLLGRRVLLLTATPIVNRLRDLITLLRLVVPEDALALDGIAALGDLEQCGSIPRALRRLVICSAGHGHRIGRNVSVIEASETETARASTAVEVIDSLRLSRDPGVRRLLHTVLLDAAASSDAALHRALQRYRSLLGHSRDGGGISRASVRRFAGEALDQLVLWEVIGRENNPELVIDDLPCLEAALQLPQHDGEWITALLACLGETRPAICFTRHRATARAMRHRIGDGAAWVTGSEAGIGPHRLSRATVLAAFGPARAHWVARRSVPRILIATDVAAEGLDLQAAGCIAHVDLPWTAMRLAQREGRLLRIGQLHDDVRIVVRHPAPEIEARLAPQARIQRKHTLSDRWLRAMRQGDHAALAEVAAPKISVLADSGPDATLIVIALTRGVSAGVRIIAREASDRWGDGETIIQRLWARVRAAETIAGDEMPGDARTTLADALQYVLGSAATAAPVAPTLIARIQRLARTAAARRDAAALSALDTLLRFAAAPQTLGGQMLLDQLHAASDQELLRTAVTDCPRSPPAAARVVAAFLFRSSAPALR